jgi:predicted ATP-grasp superfamily ATP-dependent carboligase
MVEGLTVEHIAFVDPFASTKFLASRLKQAGLSVSVIYTIKNFTTDYFTFQPELFDHAFHLIHPEQLSELITQLKAVKVTRIYYGSEISVAIADRLSQALCPQFANNPATASYRSNKFAMTEAVRLAGLPHIKQIKTGHSLTSEQEAELATWQFPVIVKPVNCSASLGVECCYSIAEVKTRLRTQTQANFFGQPVDTYLVQEYLVGSEYIIDTFSMRGEHHLSGTLRTCRSLHQRNPICLYSELAPSDHPEAAACIDYTKKVLSAVGLENGFGHTEVMYTEKGPVLIEVNPRISGANGYVNKLFQACGLPAQIDLLIAACKNLPIPIIKNSRYGRRVCLQNYIERAINPLNLPLLNELSSFVEADMLKQPGTHLSKPETLADTVAFVLLAHSNQQQVLQDHQQLLNWEQNLQLF